MQNLARNGYTADAVLHELLAVDGTRTLGFRYDLLDHTNKKLGELTNVLDCSIQYDRDADIKRTAQFTLVEDGTVNFLRDRIRPVVQLLMPDGGWVEWPQGVFLLSSPRRSIGATSAVERKVEAYDQLQVFADDLVDDRYAVEEDEKYTDAVATLLGSTRKDLTPSTKTLPTTMEWEIGTSKLEIINDLLLAVNYEALYFDEAGRAVVRPYVSPNDRAAEYEYRDDDRSVLLPGVEQSLDLFDVPNKWVLVVSESDRVPIVSSYTNDNPSSPTSTVARGRTITDFRTNEEAADQGALDARAERLAFEASQVYEAVAFTTGLMPMHSHNDVLSLTYSKLDLTAKYSEIGWSVDLRAGGEMTHEVRRVVPVG